MTTCKFRQVLRYKILHVAQDRIGQVANYKISQVATYKIGKVVIYKSEQATGFPGLQGSKSSQLLHERDFFILFHHFSLI